MIARAKESRTLDLFAAEPEAARQPPAAARPPAAEPLPARRRPLWYAVVFPEWRTAPPPDERLIRLAHRAQRFTSFVSLEPPAALLLEIRASVRLFGAPDELRRRIDADWDRIGVRARSAAAPSPLAALWLARAGEPVVIEDPAALAGRLSPLPVACTAWDPQRLERLRAIGVGRLGELLRLPRSGLARRFGPELVAELDAALARAPAPRRAFVPRERFEGRCEFDVEIEEAARLATALAPLVERCARFLRDRRAGVQRLRLCLRHRAAPTTRLTVGFAAVTGDPRRLRDALGGRLSRLQLAAPVLAAMLVSGPLESLPGGSDDAFGGAGGAADRAAGTQLIERLRSRLGEHAVYGVAAVAEHRPEAASRRVIWPCLAGPVPPAGGTGVPRPVLLLPQPLRLSVRVAPDALPGDWHLEQGPERIESGWWDGAGVERDYYVAHDLHGAQCWIFQERRDRRWYLHGVFA